MDEKGEKKINNITGELQAINTSASPWDESAETVTKKFHNNVLASQRILVYRRNIPTI